MTDLLEKLRISYDRGHYLFRKGDAAEHLYYILKGEVIIFKVVEKREIEIARIIAGDICGELALFPGSQRVFFARACESTEVVRLNEKEFKALIEADSTLIYRIMQAMAQRISQLSRRLQIELS